MIVSEALAAETAHGAHPTGFADPALWVAVAFVIVVGFVYVKARAKILSALDARAAEIKARIDDARRLREDAQAMLADYQRRQRDALKEAEDIVAHAKQEAERLRIKAEADLEASIKRREQQAMERIAQAEAQALAEVRHTAADIAIAAAGTVLKDGLGDQDRAKLVDQTIREIPARLN